MPAERVQGLRKLAEGLGVSLGTAHKLKTSGVIAEGADGWWDLNACRRALVTYRRTKSPALAAQVAADPSAAIPLPPDRGPSFPVSVAASVAVPASPGSQAEVSGQAVLLAGSDPLGVARASLAIASRALAGAGEVQVPRALDSVKRSLEELRRTEAGYLELAVQRKELVAVDVAKGVAAKVARRLVSSLDRLEDQLGGQLERWVSDDAFRALAPDARRRTVRAWSGEQTNLLRSTDADEIEKLLQAELEARA